jgi:hypothetical protein
MSHKGADNDVQVLTMARPKALARLLASLDAAEYQGPLLLSCVLFFITLGLELSDTKVYEPEIRALLGTVSYYSEAVVLKSRTVPSGTATTVHTCP